VKAATSTKRISQCILLASTVLLAAGAFAANTNKGSLELQLPAQVAGKQLASGNYEVQWQGSGDQVQLSIMQGKKSLVTTNARVVPMQAAASNNNALINVNPDGSRSVAEIRFRGKKFVLQLNGEGVGAGGSGAGR
jgi:hypothetical protein